MEHPRIDLVLRRLRCPVCGGRLRRSDRTVGCPAGHRYDLARQGYLTLLGSGGRPAAAGDTAEMVASREAFLARGHYAPVVTALTEAVARVPALDAETGPVSLGGQQPHERPADPDSAPLVLDLAGGTGHYLAAVLDAQPTAVGLDLELSPYAARRAARAHPRLATVRADVWQPLPLATGSCAAVLSVFGPRNPAETARVLAPEGRLVVVSPALDHLGEIIEPLGMLTVAPDKSERLSRQLAGFAVVDERHVRYTARLSRDDVQHEALMGPSAHHLDITRLGQAVAALPEITPVTVAVTVTTYEAPTHEEPR